MQFLKQSTACTIMFGPFVDKTDGVTLEVGAGIITSIDHATTGIFLSKAGGAAAIRHQSVTASVLDAYGMFNVTLDATDTNTVGTLDVLMAEAATFLPVHKSFMVLPANVYDSLMGTDLLDISMVQIGGVAQSATDLKDLADTGYDPSTHKVAGVVLTDTCTVNTDMRGTDSAALASAYTSTRAGYLDELAAANLITDVANVKSDTTAILEDTGTTLPGTLSTIAAYIDTEVAAILAAVDTEVAAIKAVTDALPDAGALTALLASIASILEDTGTTLPATLSTISGYVDSLETRLTADRAGYLDELAAANLPTDVDTLKTYCDILDNATNGLANIKTLIDTLDTVADAIKAKTDLQPAGIPKGVEWTCVFVMKLSADHITPATGKTVTVQVSKDGGAFATSTNSASEISNGWYKVVLTATEMNASLIAVKATETDCDQTNIGVTTSA